MIKWNKEEVAFFLNTTWKTPEPNPGDQVATFCVRTGRAELRVSPHKHETELALFTGDPEEKLASWLTVCERIDVHSDSNETPCVNLWPPPTTSSELLSWIGIYREGKYFTIFSGTVPGLPAAPRTGSAPDLKWLKP